MKVTVLKGVLPTRDAELSDIPQKFYTQVDLSVYQKSVNLKVAKQEGHYRSNQGATITPIPLWAIEFNTYRRKIGGKYQTIPARDEGKYLAKTARWAKDVSGTGVEKEKWRGIEIAGRISLTNIFTVVTSAWLVPFALAHRYVVHIPAEIKGKGKQAVISVRHDLADYRTGRLKGWMEPKDDLDETAIADWTRTAQKIWDKTKTDKSSDLVTDRLDYQKTLSNQKPKSIRVVHTRSRTFYAAVLNPKGTTALGLPYDAVKLQTIEGGEIIDETYLPAGGVICDNLLHSIAVDSEEEAYWMMGLFNSPIFNKIVMDKALGEPPGIYTLPVKMMDHFGIEFDASDENHIKLADVAKSLEKRMKKTLVNYLSDEKEIRPDFVDDTDQSEDVPSTISSALMNRLDDQDSLDELNEVAKRILKNDSRKKRMTRLDDAR